MRIACSIRSDFLLSIVMGAAVMTWVGLVAHGEASAADTKTDASKSMLELCL
jgi:hypothetical protein